MPFFLIEGPLATRWISQLSHVTTIFFPIIILLCVVIFSTFVSSIVSLPYHTHTHIQKDNFPKKHIITTINLRKMRAKERVNEPMTICSLLSSPFHSEFGPRALRSSLVTSCSGSSPVSFRRPANKKEKPSGKLESFPRSSFPAKVRALSVRWWCLYVNKFSRTKKAARPGK